MKRLGVLLLDKMLVQSRLTSTSTLSGLGRSPDNLDHWMTRESRAARVEFHLTLCCVRILHGVRPTPEHNTMTPCERSNLTRRILSALCKPLGQTPSITAITQYENQSSFHDFESDNYLCNAFWYRLKHSPLIFSWDLGMQRK